MSHPRKSKPLAIFREETHGCGPYNSTRQTFDQTQYNEWKAYDKRYPLAAPQERRFFVGSIEWEEATSP